MNILSRQDKWFDKGVKESIYVKLERPTMNRGGGLRHYLSTTYKDSFNSYSYLRKKLKHVKLTTIQHLELA